MSGIGSERHSDEMMSPEQWARIHQLQREEDEKREQEEAARKEYRPGIYHDRLQQH